MPELTEVIDKKDIEVMSNVPTNTVKEVTSLSAAAPVQEEIDIDLKEKIKQEKTKFSMKDTSYLKNLMGTPKETPGGGNSSQEDIKKRLLGDTGASGGSLGTDLLSTASENFGHADIIVEVVDWLLVAIIHWFSKSDSDKDYKTDKEKKNILKKIFFAIPG